ncbi:MAG: hypothetical protein IT375_05575 [Polyangiaceae bacterium]|nr:hypothetical protein [Polyangiaceae bacterium]
MPRPPLADWLKARGAHNDLVTWSAAFDDDWQRFWQECPRGDWLLSLAARLGVERPRLVRAASAAARTALEGLPESEPSPRAALELAEAWADGQASAEACRARSLELERYSPPDPALAAVGAAALSALMTVEDPDSAAGAAANAAQAALFGAGDCALLSLLSYAQRQTAERVREHLPFEAVAPLI